VSLDYDAAGVTLIGSECLLGHVRFLYSGFLGENRAASPSYEVDWDPRSARFRVRLGDEVELEGEGEAEALEALDWYAASHLLGDLEAGVVVLHAACLELPGGGLVALVGPSGSGKSTLAAALLQLGGRFLSDEFVPIDHDSLRPWAYPRALGLKNGAPIGPGAFEAERRVGRRSEAGRWLRPRRRLSPGPQGQVLRLILEVAFGPGVGVRLEPRSPARVLASMLGQAPMLADDRSAGFASLAALADAVPGYRLAYDDATLAARRLLALADRTGGRA
jgi:hypothetical protein